MRKESARFVQPWQALQGSACRDFARQQSAVRWIDEADQPKRKPCFSITLKGGRLVLVVEKKICRQQGGLCAGGKMIQHLHGLS